MAWAPGLIGPDASIADLADADPSAYPESVPDPFDDLDLVITPVSVTPPRTWRRAAWFAVGASCVVLTVLVFAASRLAGPEGPFERLDAFPGLPTGGLLTAHSPEPPPPAETTGSEPTREDDQAALGMPSSTGDTPVTAFPGQPDVRQSGVRPGGPSRTTSPASSSPGGLQNPTTGPTVSVLPSTGSPPVTAENLIAATQRFYNALPKDLETAWAMVGPRVKVQGFENFRRQWAGVDEVHLQEVLVNGNDSSVLATVLVVPSEGGQFVQHYRLVFRQGNMLTIEDIYPAGSEDGNKPVR